MKTIQIESVTLEDFLNSISLEISKCLLEHAKRSDCIELLTRKQLRDKFGLSYSTIHRYVSKGILTPRRIGGKVFFDSKHITQVISNKI